MDNPANPIYISYNGNTVGINRNVRENGQWVQTLFTCGDLIQAATEDSTRRLLGLPVEYGPLSLKLPEGVAHGLRLIEDRSLKLSTKLVNLPLEVQNNEDYPLLIGINGRSLQDIPIAAESTISRLIEEGNQPLYEGQQALHRRISELQEPISERMSQCSAQKFSDVQRYFQLQYDEIQWTIVPTLQHQFPWNGRNENDYIPEIVQYFSNAVDRYQFRDCRNVNVAVEYRVGSRDACQNGKLDIAVLLPDQIATMRDTVLCQCVSVIEIKTPEALERDTEKCINQCRLQLIALSVGGNDHHPFALLTDVANYWRFMWLTQNNTVMSVLFDSPQQGLAALKEGLDLMNGQQNTCRFFNRCGIKFPDVTSGHNDGVADLSDFYDEMTDLEVLHHKRNVGIYKVFQMMTPSQRANFTLD